MPASCRHGGPAVSAAPEVVLACTQLGESIREASLHAQLETVLAFCRSQPALAAHGDAPRVLVACAVDAARSDSDAGAAARALLHCALFLEAFAEGGAAFLAALHEDPLSSQPAFVRYVAAFEACGMRPGILAELRRRIPCACLREDSVPEGAAHQEPPV